MYACIWEAKRTDIRFLEHAGMASRNVVNTHATAGARAPAEQRISILLNVRFIGALTAGGPEQHELAMENPFRAGSSFQRRDKQFGLGSVPRPEAIAAPDPSRNGTISSEFCIPQIFQFPPDQ